MSSTTVTSPDDGLGRARTTARLSILFGMIYFVQGVAEPTAGLIAQPVRSLLRDWGLGAGEIATFMLWIGLPWYFKPVFGLLSDLVPILGSRRRSYLLIMTLMTAAGLFVAGGAELAPGATTGLAVMLVLPCLGIAFTDVVTDALMVERGQPLGITGRLQSVQWAALYLAGALTGVAGGYLSARDQQQDAFVVCGALTLITFVIALVVVKEPRAPRSTRGQARRTIRTAWDAVRRGPIGPIALFLLLLNFNPFSADVLYVHMADGLGFSEESVGLTYSISSVGAVVACVVYGAVAPRLSTRVLVHGSIVTMVVCSLAYLGVSTPMSAYIVSAIVGIAYMGTTLIQLDLAARFCPPAAAGTLFALLMSLSNLSYSMSSVLGGRAYDGWQATLGADRAFETLVVVGTACTAACWVVVRLLPRHDPTHAPSA